MKGSTCPAFIFEQIFWQKSYFICYLERSCGERHSNSSSLPFFMDSNRTTVRKEISILSKSVIGPALLTFSDDLFADESHEYPLLRPVEFYS